ncbi:MAG: S28 family serine protease [Kofleriaceae bacterium]|nr:S28 family serine protease [Kofleriaceae bacterium]
MRFSVVASLALVAGCGDNLSPAAPDAPLAPDAYVAVCNENDVEASLKTVPGVTSVFRVPCEGAVRGPATCYALQFQQPIHATIPNGPTFVQNLQLVHRSCDAPMVVADWGYASFGFFDDELSSLYRTNSLWIEHRYQGESIPEPYNWDWTALTIENGANDMHHVVQGFRQHYRSRWISTGASKGGITALYHRYFFPDDVDGSVPYVAPASRQRVDPIYQQYLDANLPNPCAQSLRNLQISTLTTRRDAMLQKIRATIGGGGYEAYYLESMVASLDWGFWQVAGVEACTSVPSSEATDDEVWDFIYNLFGTGAHPAVDETKSEGALTYEWLTEQGFALQIGRHISQLLQLPDATPTMEQRFAYDFPGVDLPAYNSSVTQATRAWARDQAENLVLIYGQFDPWSGGALDAPVKASSGRYVVPQASHSAAISSLPEAERAEALAHVSRMLGKEPVGSFDVARQAAKHRDALIGATMRRTIVRSSIPSAAR